MVSRPVNRRRGRKPEVLSPDRSRNPPHVDNILTLHDEFLDNNVKVRRCLDPPFSEFPNPFPSLGWRESDVMIQSVLRHYRGYAVHVLSVPSLQFFHHNAQVLSLLRTKIGNGLGIAVQQILFRHVLRIRDHITKRLLEFRVIRVIRCLLTSAIP